MRRAPRRVVITGMGSVSPCGNDVPSLWQALVHGRSGIGPITKFDSTAFASKIAGEVRDLDLDRSIPVKDQSKMDAFIHFAMAAAHEAMHDAGFDDGLLSSAERERFGVLLGSGIGGITTVWNEASRYRGPRRTSPFFIPSIIVNQASGFVSIRWGLQGPNSAVATACATGTHAIGDAARLIAHGYADRMLAGGCESGVNPLEIGGFASMNALSTRNEEPTQASRPFDLGRDGFVLSEGSAVVVLEELELALARGVEIHAEVVGYSQTGDAHHITRTAADCGGMVRAMSLALDDADVAPEAIGYINAHATSTPAGDRAECHAIRAVFGKHSSKLAISSTKSVTGHLLGAAGALETIAAVMTGKTGVIPPTINVCSLDPECDLNVTPNSPGRLESEYVLNNSFGFGGTNTCMVLRTASR